MITSKAAPGDRVDLLREVADVLVFGDHEVDLTAALDELAGRGMRRQLCEGGPTLLSGLIRAGLLDELCLTTRWALAGPNRLTMTGGQAWEGLIPLQPSMLLAGEGVMFGRYEVPKR